MGLEFNAARFLILAREQGVSFDKTLTLGHQWLILSPREIKKICNELGSIASDIIRPDGFSDNFLKALGTKELRILDFSGYEGADIVHDLNRPLEGVQKSAFDVVIDGGTLEHVFNFPQALKNAMELVKVGGRLFSITPTNNFCGHGFYQLSPELYYRSLCEANGYTVERIYAHQWGHNAWYSVSDPDMIKGRVEITRGRHPTLLMVQALRTAERPIFATPPLQSDYVAAWQRNQAGGKGKFLQFLHRSLPPSVLNLLRLGSAYARDPFRRARSLKDARYFTRIQAGNRLSTAPRAKS